MMREQKKQKGFTLIEVIVTIVIAALVGLVVFAYLGNTLTRSHEPIGLVQDLGEAMAVMEGFASEYNRYLRSEGSVSWTDFTDKLTAADEPIPNLRGTGSFSNDIDVLKVTVTRNGQTVFALFSKFYKDEP